MPFDLHESVQGISVLSDLLSAPIRARCDEHGYGRCIALSNSQYFLVGVCVSYCVLILFFVCLVK